VIDEPTHLHLTADPIVVELAPYRQRRRTRRFAAGLLLGYLAGAWLLPAAADQLEGWLVATDLADPGEHVARVAAYAKGGGDG
jgi:hypothetical protein